MANPASATGRARQSASQPLGAHVHQHNAGGLRDLDTAIVCNADQRTAGNFDTARDSHDNPGNSNGYPSAALAYAFSRAPNQNANGHPNQHA